MQSLEFGGQFLGLSGALAPTGFLSLRGPWLGEGVNFRRFLCVGQNSEELTFILRKSYQMLNRLSLELRVYNGLRGFIYLLIFNFMNPTTN